MRKIFIWNILLALFALCFIQCRKYEINNDGYAIGTINWYEIQVLWFSSAEINYTFIVNGTVFGNQYTNRQWGKEFKVPALKDYNKGDQFMVQYDKTNPGSTVHSSYQNRMLFNYPVKDSNDYKNYVNEFITNPPI